MQSFEKIDLIVKNTHIKYCQKDLNYLVGLRFTHKILVKATSAKVRSVLRAPFINKKSQLKFIKKDYAFKVSSYVTNGFLIKNNTAPTLRLFFTSIVPQQLAIVNICYTKHSFYF